ncbi:MAG: hypothetical protein HY735_04190 [Verrucomicrobia bacterium]|nr:hypothetical protein [Verrucomicrobiota bacterium]
MATGTETVTSTPLINFTYTVTGTATETWTEKVVENVTITAGPSGRGGTQEKFFVPAKTDTARVTAAGDESPPWGVALELEGRALFSASRPRSVMIDVFEGKSYRIIASGNGSISVRYPGQVTEERTAERKAMHSAPASVSAKEGEKYLGAAPFAAYPRSQQAGSMGDSTFQISDDNERVETRVDGANLYARTAFVELISQRWQKQESGKGTVGTADGSKSITLSTLAAPNADTRWSVENDNPNVETWMDGNRLFAKVVQIVPPNYHSADYQDPRSEIDDSEMNRVLAYWRAGAYHIDSQGLDGFRRRARCNQRSTPQRGFPRTVLGH